MKIKRCRNCGKDLYCKACGVRQTPEYPKQVNIHLTDEQKELVEASAASLGFSVNEFLRQAATNPRVKEILEKGKVYGGSKKSRSRN